MHRKDFLTQTGSCLSYLAFAGPLLPPGLRERWHQTQAHTLSQEPFARLEEVGPGLTAVISTPLTGDFTTICNGGIIQGTNGTLVVEAFGTADGARWVAEHARRITGRWPTHVVVSHYHGDHTAGASGFGEPESPPELRATGHTRERTLGSLDEEADRAPWADVVVLPSDAPTVIDLGGRSVSVVPRAGHTGSDVTVEVEEDGGAIWCGDLVWNDMFPNYMDAVPSELSTTVRTLQALNASVYVGGHGPVGDSGAYDRYVGLIDSVEHAGREAFRRGMNAEDAAAEYQVPEALGEWHLFNPLFFQRAMESWLRELSE
ncbi:MAG: MBL fold metallo-hydrolase [Longimicrobiales bacterium]